MNVPKYTTIGGVSLAAFLAVSMLAVPSAFASLGLAKNNPDFDITDVQRFTMTVAGTAGGTVPADQDHVFAYAFVLDKCTTDLCAYGVTSHYAEDSTEVGSDIEWHAHYVEVTGGCVSTLTEDGDALLSGNEVSVTGANGKVVAGLTAVFVIDERGVCVQDVLDFEPA